MESTRPLSHFAAVANQQQLDKAIQNQRQAIITPEAQLDALILQWEYDNMNDLVVLLHQRGMTSTTDYETIENMMDRIRYERTWENKHLQLTEFKA